MSGEFDPALAFRTLNQHQVRYVVIGGLASDLLGAPISTNDIDICYERTRENMERLAGALRQLEATLRVANVNEEVPFIVDHRTLAGGDCFTFRTNAGDLDVLGRPSGTGGFRDLDAGAATYDLGDDLTVRVVGIDDLIRMKEASGRPKDEAHLHVLVTLKEMLDEAE